MLPFTIFENVGRREIGEEAELSEAISFGRNHAHDNNVCVVIREQGKVYPVRFIWPDGEVENCDAESGRIG